MVLVGPGKYAGKKPISDYSGGDLWCCVDALLEEFCCFVILDKPFDIFWLQVEIDCVSFPFLIRQLRHLAFYCGDPRIIND